MQIDSKRIHSGRVINLDIDTVRFPDGSTGELEIIRHPGAAAVVPFASDPRGPDPTVLLIQQYRYAANGSLIEVPAGRLNPGEDPEVCARRELLEEVGVTAGRLERLTTIWTTPGFTDERIHLFWASELKADKHAREPRVHRSSPQAVVRGAANGAKRRNIRRQDGTEPFLRGWFHPGALALSSFGSRSNVELCRPQARTIFPFRIPLPLATDCHISG